MSLGELFLRIAIGFVTLLTLTRIMGRKEISQMTFFNFISAITIGTIGGSLAVDSNLSIRNGVFALVGWTLFTLVMGFIDIKSKTARAIIEGQPLIVIKDGKIMEDQLRKARLDVDALNVLLRENKVFALSEVDYAVFETDGKLSVLKKVGKQTITNDDLGIQKNNLYSVSTGVIFDGKINKENLSKLNLKEDWVMAQLNQAGIQSISEVFYAEIQKDGSLYIDNRNDTIH